MMAAISSVLFYFDFALPIFPAFLKMDFSDIPSLIAAFAYGPISGILVQLVKNLLHLTITSTWGIGELANFIVGSALVVPAGLVYQRRHDIKGALTGLVCATVSMSIVGLFANYFILIPFYASRILPMDAIISLSNKIIPFINDKFTLVLFAIVPFNLLKGIVISIITLLLYKRVRHLLSKISLV